MQEPSIEKVLEALRTSGAPLDEWQRGFLRSVSQQKRPLRPLQRATLLRMAEAYLDPGLVAEIYGQQRLFE